MKKKPARNIDTQMVLFEVPKKKKKEITPEQKEYLRKKNLGKLIDFLEKLDGKGAESPLF